MDALCLSASQFIGSSLVNFPRGTLENCLASWGRTGTGLRRLVAGEDEINEENNSRNGHTEDDKRQRLRGTALASIFELRNQKNHDAKDDDFHVCFCELFSETAMRREVSWPQFRGRL